MGSTDAVIDLDAPPARTVRPRFRYEVVLVALLLLTVGAAAPVPRRAALVQVADTEGQVAYASLLTASALYTAEGSVVRARPLSPGAPRWTMPVITGADGVKLSRSGSVLIADAGPESVCTFLDAATGALLWQTQVYDQVDVVGERVAVWGHDDEKLRVVELRTGRTRWKRPVVVGAMAHGAGGRVLVTFDYDGKASSFDVASGRVLARDRNLSGGEVPELDADLHENIEVTLGATVAGDQLYLYRNASVTAYRLTDLQRLWQTRTGASRITACGVSVCATVPTGISLLDPATGVVRRTGAGWRSVTPDGVVVAGGGQATLVDLATGRDLRPLGHGEPAGDLMLMWDNRGMWVVERRHGRSIALLPGVDPIRCAAVADRLACPTAGGTMTVWAVPKI